MTETTQPKPTFQAIPPHVWTRPAGMPDVEIYHEEVGAINVAIRRVPGVAVMNSGGALPQGDPGIEIPWNQP
jgi:hypothetical protein